MPSQGRNTKRISRTLQPVNSIPDGHCLADRTAYGHRPWREKSMGTIHVAQAFQKVDPAKAARCAQCGKTLVFAECPSDPTHPKRLKHANFCKIRLCPMCAWRRTLKLGAQVSAVLHEAFRQRPNHSLVMLTLTQRNVPAQELRDEIGRVLKAWKLLTLRKDLRSVVGWFRVLEVTRNDRTSTWHPHVHALLLVRPSYYGKGYIPQKRWCQLWAESLRVDYTPVVDVHRVKPRGARNTLDAAALEVSKYTVKEMDLIGADPTDTAERVRVLDHALRRRRLIAFGGILKTLAKELRDVPAPDEAGACDDPTCPVCGSPLRERLYRWLHWVRQYVADDTEPSTRP